MNKTISMGNLTDDPKITYTQGGKAKAEFTLALNRYKDGADFPRFIAWEKKAEILEKWCHKGMKLLVIGHIQTGSYEGKNGKVYTTDIIVDEIEFCEKKKDDMPPEGIGEETNDNGWMLQMPDGINEEIPFS